MQYHATKQLDVIVYHVPHCIVATGNPVMLPQCLVTVYDNKVMLGGQVTVKIRGGNLNLLVLRKAAGGILDYGKYVRENLIQNHLIAVHDLFLQLVYLIEQRLAILHLSLLYLSLKLLYAFLFRYYKVLDFAAYLLCCGTQLIIGQFFILGIRSLDFLHPRLNLLYVAGLLITKKLPDKFIKTHYAVSVVFVLILSAAQKQNPCRNAKIMQAERRKKKLVYFLSQGAAYLQVPLDLKRSLKLLILHKSQTFLSYHLF